MIHGLEDKILSPICSEEVYRLARNPKELHLLPGTGHLLDEVADEVKLLCMNWIKTKL
ncbi:alpha/beta hydrolase [Parachlamydia sp. AcF125]|uniref:alpha/beta hydrolase n=1 Tax=Parachlamydia sp. AcF125 TaxID=2795736 RepID=UPI001BC97414|nr:alpha/beta hydrolase [Parachlamydia sp. AcF125]